MCAKARRRRTCLDFVLSERLVGLAETLAYRAQSRSLASSVRSLGHGVLFRGLRGTRDTRPATSRQERPARTPDTSGAAAYQAALKYRPVSRKKPVNRSLLSGAPGLPSALGVSPTRQVRRQRSVPSGSTR